MVHILQILVMATLININFIEGGFISHQVSTQSMLKKNQHNASGIECTDLWPLIATKATPNQPIFKGPSLMTSFV